MNIIEQRTNSAYAILAQGKLSRKQLAMKLKVKERAISEIITEIRKQGHVVRCETGSVYWLDDEARDNARFENRYLDAFI